MNIPLDQIIVKILFKLKHEQGTEITSYAVIYNI